MTLLKFVFSFTSVPSLSLVILSLLINVASILFAADQALRPSEPTFNQRVPDFLNSLFGLKSVLKK